jgi:hypothetical protein
VSPRRRVITRGKQCYRVSLARVNPGDVGVHDCRTLEWQTWSTVSHSFRNSGDLAPNAERSGANGAVIIGSQAMAAKLEVVVDTALGGKESLSMAG